MYSSFDDLQVLDTNEMAWLDVNEGNGTNTDRMSRLNNDGSNNRGRQISNDHPSSLTSFDNSWEMINDSGGCGTGGDSRTGNDNNQRSWSTSTSSSTWDLLGGQDGTTMGGDDNGIKFADWKPYAGSTGSYPLNSSANPNDEDIVPSVDVFGKPPGRRAGHTATAVSGRFIYIFGGEEISIYSSTSHV